MPDTMTIMSHFAASDSRGQSSSSSAQEHASDGAFPLTRWSMVARAGSGRPEEAAAALAELCGWYWYPLYAYTRRHARDAETAQDLIQDFFADLLERRAIAA